MTKDFWANVDARGTGCWPWKGAVTQRGYGYLSYNGRTKLAHRIAWEQTNSTLLPLECIGWTCENRLCCNPDHMFKYRRKSHDGEVHTRTRRGEEHPNARLRLWQIEEMRQFYATGSYTYKRLSKRYEVSQKQIGRIIRGEQWKEEAK